MSFSWSYLAAVWVGQPEMRDHECGRKAGGRSSSSEGQPCGDQPVCLCVGGAGGVGFSQPSTACPLPESPRQDLCKVSGVLVRCVNAFAVGRMEQGEEPGTQGRKWSREGEGLSGHHAAT